MIALERHELEVAASGSDRARVEHAYWTGSRVGCTEKIVRIMRELCRVTPRSVDPKLLSLLSLFYGRQPGVQGEGGDESHRYALHSLHTRYLIWIRS